MIYNHVKEKFYFVQNHSTKSYISLVKSFIDRPKKSTFHYYQRDLSSTFGQIKVLFHHAIPLLARIPKSLLCFYIKIGFCDIFKKLTLINMKYIFCK